MDLFLANMKQSTTTLASHITLQIEDLNGFISSLKKREENFIQILDFSIKYIETNAPEAKQTSMLHSQMAELERSRIKREDIIIEKYNGYKAMETKQKK